MKETGKMIKPVVLVSSLIPIMLFMRENGLKTFSMDVELNLGMAELLDIQANSTKARRMVKVNLNGKTEATMKETL